MDDLGFPATVISTPLCSAARKGQSVTIRRLLAEGHNVNLNDNRGWTPLHEAVANGHVSCVELLLQHEECNVNVRTYDGMSPIYVACQYQNSIELIKILAEHGVSCNIGNTENVTPLHIASKLYKLELVKELLKHDADINAQDYNHFTPLMEAIEQITNVCVTKQEACFEVVHFLLDNGARLSMTDLYGRTALFIATGVKWKECIQLLLEYGSDVNARTMDGGTALFVAAELGCFELVKILLDHGAETDIICKSETVPLHHALHNGHVSVAEELIGRMNFKEIIRKQNNRLESFLILSIDSGSFESFKLVINNRIYSCEDSAPLSVVDNATMLDDICFRHYIYLSPASFLLSYHIEEPHSVPMLKRLLDSGDFSVNARNEDFIPPIVALIAASFKVSNQIPVNKVKQECFVKLLENGADIDYNSVKNCPGSLAIPDAVMAVITHNKCNIQQSLLLPVLAHCFACDWDDLLEWMVKHHTCCAAVINVLIRLGTKARQSLLQLWELMKQCSCDICKKEFPNIKKHIYEKEYTLQSLCRAKVRHWLWQKARKSNEAEKFLHKMQIPLLIKQYIVPVNL